MTPENFCYWLQGLFELSDVDKNKTNHSLSMEQVKCIKEHLGYVFNGKQTAKASLGPYTLTQTAEPKFPPQTTVIC